MRILSHLETLTYYDGLSELFVAHDQMDIPYVCVLVEEKDDSAKYLCVPVSKVRYTEFISGDVDLLTLIKTSETGEIYLSHAEKGNLVGMQTTTLSESDILDAWLPKPGFIVKMPMSMPNIG